MSQHLCKLKLFYKRYTKFNLTKHLSNDLVYIQVNTHPYINGLVVPNQLQNLQKYNGFIFSLLYRIRF